jgi:hypothetical protein
MALRTMFLLTVAAVLALLLLTSCSTSAVYRAPGKRIGHGPPAHAQAHGYHRKHVAGVELVYDSGRGLYVVAGFPNHYYHDGYFYRLHGTVWEVSLRCDGGWASVSQKSLPPGLQAKGKVKPGKASYARGRKSQ